MISLDLPMPGEPFGEAIKNRRARAAEQRVVRCVELIGAEPADLVSSGRPDFSYVR